MTALRSATKEKETVERTQQQIASVTMPAPEGEGASRHEGQSILGGCDVPASERRSKPTVKRPHAAAREESYSPCSWTSYYTNGIDDFLDGEDSDSLDSWEPQDDLEALLLVRLNEFRTASDSGDSMCDGSGNSGEGRRARNGKGGEGDRRLPYDLFDSPSSSDFEDELTVLRQALMPGVPRNANEYSR